MFPLYRNHKTWMSGQSNILLWKKPKLWIFSFWFPFTSTVTRKYLESRTKWKQKFDEQLSAHVASIRMTSPKRLWILPTLNSVINCARELLPLNGARANLFGFKFSERMKSLCSLFDTEEWTVATNQDTVIQKWRKW